MNIPSSLRGALPLAFGLIGFFTCFVPKVNAFGRTLESPDSTLGVTTVVIDAGHGGKDPGAVGGEVKEKDVVLDVALELGQMIRSRFDDVEVIQTRTEDTFVPLMERAKIANRNQADLFISVHANVAGNTDAHGTETYVLGLHRTEANMKVAKKENSVILMEEDYKTRYENFDPKSPESYIALELMQSEFLDQSLDFAAMAQKHFEREGGRHNRGVKQAGFLVLYKTTMPSVLVELGFLSNASDKKFLVSEKGQDQLARSLFNALKDYKTAMDRVEIARGKREPGEKGEKKGDKANLTASTGKATPSSGNEEEQKEKGKEKENAEPKGEKEGSEDTEDIRFRVQIVASSSSIPIKPENFKGFENVNEYISNGVYKYTVGNKKNYNDARELREEVRKKGYSGAFIIAMKDGMRIDLQKALSLKSH